MNLFIRTESGKLQNLFLLQDVRVVNSESDPNKFALGYVQENGMIVEDMIFDTEAEAQAKVDKVISELINQKGGI